MPVLLLGLDLVDLVGLSVVLLGLDFLFQLPPLSLLLHFGGRPDVVDMLNLVVELAFVMVLPGLGFAVEVLFTLEVCIFDDIDDAGPVVSAAHFIEAPFFIS